MNTITGTTGLTALLGSPVSHSISPLMHNEAFRLLGLDYVYLCFDVDEKALPEAVAGLKACGIRGFNLTMPDKNAIVPLLDELSEAASMIGAVNTVVHENGRLIGHNTDGVGFMRSAREAGYDLAGQTITLLGGGGAATAICAQAALDGVEIIHLFLRRTSRFYGRMEALAARINRDLSCRIHLHEQGDEAALADALRNSALLINATSVGMAPHTEESLITDLSPYRGSDLVVSDVIYNPKETRLLRNARENGLRTFNGMYMLLYQGAEAFRLWTGQDMPVQEIKPRFFT